MSDGKQTFTKEQLKNFSQPLLAEMVSKLLEQQEESNRQIRLLTEQVNLLNQQRYGRHTEKSSQIDHQMVMCFNEAEVLFVDSSELQLKEPTLADVNPENAVQKPAAKKRRPHPKGTRENMLKALPQKDVPCELSGEDLKCECGGTYQKLSEKPETVTRLEFHPATFEVVNYQVYTYRCNHCGDIRRAPGPSALFEGSLATESLLAGIMTGKYVNAAPFRRMEDMFADHNALIRRQTMARWMIMAAFRYFLPLYDRLIQELLSYDIIHADETTVEVSKDERKAGSKSYMWVYTSEGSDPPVVIFEYQKTRAAYHAREFLEDFHGYLCCDGYEGYHSLNPDITVCGCWSHSRRHYANAVKALRKDENRKKELTVSEEALKKIGELFVQDKSYKELSESERKSKRDTELRQKVNDYFEWVQNKIGTVPPKSETGKGLAYSINQKPYLLAFLETANVPMDNSEAERKIRNFVISRKNFVLIDTIGGAEASAILFSMAETAKANRLRPYAYFKYLLEKLQKMPQQKVPDEKRRKDFQDKASWIGHKKEIIAQQRKSDRNNHELQKYLSHLLPWSSDLPEEIKKQENEK